MNCQKCGAPMVAGHLYCDICGSEYQIVPDFEPELENSIARTLSHVGEAVEEETAVFHSDSNKAEEAAAKRHIPKSPSFFKIFLWVFLGLATAYSGFYGYSHTTDYISGQALQAMETGEYEDAAEIYGDLRKKEPGNAHWYIEEAEALLVLGEKNTAEQLALQAIRLSENQKEVFDFLLSFYQQEEQYQKMHNLLLQCSYESVLKKYAGFLAGVPKVNYDSGFYEESLEVILENENPGVIYYTLDGSQPDESDKVYSEPIRLGNGSHRLRAVFKSRYGVFSEILEKNYAISSSIPLAPVVKLESGTYNVPQMIVVEIEEGTSVYYTTDSSKPTKESPMYTEPVPLPLGESQFHFIAYSEGGEAGDVTRRNFLLNMKTGLTLEEAESILVQKLIEAELLLDRNGALQNRYGVHRYFYQYPVAIGESNYYIFAEHYLENEINDPTGRFYGVEVMKGESYRLTRDETGNFTVTVQI